MIIYIWTIDALEVALWNADSWRESKSISARMISNGS